MKNSKFRMSRYIKKCWREISFKDKGLILIMIALLLQCIHSLYNPVPTNSDYSNINIIMRTSVAGIFGYFLSSNFLSNLDATKNNQSTEHKLMILDQLLKDDKISEEIKDEYNKQLKEDRIEEKEDEEIYLCNKSLQNGIAVGICLIIIFSLVIGVNFNLIVDGASVTIAQFRDIVSGCIGFLLGNNNSDSAKKA
ncbi:Uncharacterised protein [uncultured Clostridium sp.]|uniref:hypothetical protein n=1 Tax=uncultured Clostridium sp. TaxID=59620 RepID=UPI000822862A|nr:hypothetical protein [uncultured Clostridium sp.]SCJ03404.1 Uncharacterised protein [uncultured Clostridium sp.]